MTVWYPGEASFERRGRVTKQFSTFVCRGELVRGLLPSFNLGFVKTNARLTSAQGADCVVTELK